LKNPDEEDPEDFYYERIANDSVRVESLSFQGYTLPPFHVICCSISLRIENWRAAQGQIYCDSKNH